MPSAAIFTPPLAAVEPGGAGIVGTATPVTSDQEEVPLVEDELDDFASALDALAKPYEYVPVQLSFGCFGPLSADTQVLRLRNICGKRIEVKDEAGNLLLQGTGHFKPVGYHFDFSDCNGFLAFSVATVDMHEDEIFEFISPSRRVIATATRKRFHRRTDIRICANTRKSPDFVEVECKSAAKGALAGGRYQVATPEGNVLGTIRRHYRKGVLTHQNFTLVVGPEVDPYLLVFLAVVCNCVNNERSKVGWALGAASLVSILA